MPAPPTGLDVYRRLELLELRLARLDLDPVADPVYSRVTPLGFPTEQQTGSGKRRVTNSTVATEQRLFGDVIGIPANNTVTGLQERSLPEPGSSDNGKAIVYSSSSDAFTYSNVASVGSTLTVNFTSVGNVGAGEDDLMSYSVPAATLGANGDSLEVIAWGEFAANGNAKRLRLKFGATTMYDSGALSPNAGAWRVAANIVRKTGTTQDGIAQIVTANTAVIDEATHTTPGETLSGAVTLKLTGDATADNDVVQYGMIVRNYPV